MNRRELIAQFDQFSPYTDDMIARGIETHRKGLFAVKVKYADGKPAFRVLDRLINREWHTELQGVTDQDGRLYFYGFYGDYQLAVGSVSENRRFYKENTGYYGVTAGPMEQKLILPT